MSLCMMSMLRSEQTELMSKSSTKKEKEVILIEMSCPWMENREVRAEENTRKCGPLRWERKTQYSGYKVTQHNIMDVLGGYSKDMVNLIKSLVGERIKVLQYMYQVL